MWQHFNSSSNVYSFVVNLFVDLLVCTHSSMMSDSRTICGFGSAALLLENVRVHIHLHRHTSVVSIGYVRVIVFSLRNSIPKERRRRRNITVDYWLLVLLAMWTKQPYNGWLSQAVTDSKRKIVASDSIHMLISHIARHSDIAPSMSLILSIGIMRIITFDVAM